MGHFFSYILRKPKKEKQIVFVGLDSAGKTSMVNRMMTGQVTKPNHTMGYMFEIFSYKEYQIASFDFGGHGERMRDLWRHYYHNIDFLIYVFDSDDKTRLDENNRTLEEKVLNCSGTIPLLFLANKQDMENSFSAKEISDIYNLDKIKNRKWDIIGTSVMTGEGIEETLDYIIKTESPKYRTFDV